MYCLQRALTSPQPSCLASSLLKKVDAFSVQTGIRVRKQSPKDLADFSFLICQNQTEKTLFFLSPLLNVQMRMEEADSKTRGALTLPSICGYFLA